MAIGVAIAVAGARSAHADETVVGVDYLDKKVLELVDIDTEHPHPAKFEIRGRLLPSYRNPRVSLIRPNGRAYRLEHVGTTGDLKRFTVPLRLSHGKGVYRLEITATTTGDRTHSGVRLRLFIGVPATAADEPYPEDIRPPPDVTEVLLESRFFKQVNDFRKEVGLEQVKWCEPVARLARLHSQASAKVKRVDHRLDDDNDEGNLAHRLYQEYRWDRVIYRVPIDRQTNQVGASSYVAVAVDARKGIDAILARWKRFPAFCLPLSSEVLTHCACGIARSKGGNCYLTFAFIQINGTQIPQLLAGRFDNELREFRRTVAADERPRMLRELGLWRHARATKESRKHDRSKDPAMRAAAWDVALILEEKKTRKALSKLWGRVVKNIDDKKRTAEALNAVAWMSRLQNVAPLAVVAKLGQGKLEEQAGEALAAVEQAVAGEEDPDAAATVLAKGLKDVLKRYPGTEAAGKAAKRLSDS